MRWTLDDIDWSAFDASKVDRELLKAVKAAALVEFNSPDYVSYLKNVFHDHPKATANFDQWGLEEAQHGRALARWAKLADPSFDFEARFARFRKMQGVQTDAIESIRGSRAGEMVARCVVESGTSSFYSAIKDSTDEPCLKQIATYLAADEFAHYRCFMDIYQIYEEREPISTLSRLKVAIERVKEADDAELAAAYYCANYEEGDAPFEIRRFSKAYQRRALGVYGERHINRLVSMVLKAGGLTPHTPLSEAICRLVWRIWGWRIRRLETANA